MFFDRANEMKFWPKPAVLMSLLLLPTSLGAEPLLTLEFVSSHKINAVAGLTEPSGLAISAISGELWVVSDDTSSVYKLSPKAPLTAVNIPINEKEMEGIALAESDAHFYTLNEKKGRISQFSMVDGQRLERRKISAMTGYADIRAIVAAAGRKNGFEGLAWHEGRKSLFAVLEGPPGLLVEISADLSTILMTRPLTPERGFVDPESQDQKIDFSGLSYDATRECLWILSDEAARVFLFDLAADKVTTSLSLQRLTRKGNLKKVKKAEGIALSADGTELFIVSDSKASLYRWRIRENH